jgi:hypothetical protein
VWKWSNMSHNHHHLFQMLLVLDMRWTIAELALNNNTSHTRWRQGNNEKDFYIFFPSIKKVIDKYIMNTSTCISLCLSSSNVYKGCCIYTDYFKCYCTIIKKNWRFQTHKFNIVLTFTWCPLSNTTLSFYSIPVYYCAIYIWLADLKTFLLEIVRLISGKYVRNDTVLTRWCYFLSSRKFMALVWHIFHKEEIETIFRSQTPDCIL